MLARETVAAWAQGRAAPPPAVPGAERPAGAFVSLYRHGELRGCIGHLEADQPLAEVVAAMAVAAARDDPRFPPLGADEVDELEVEVSVLSPCAPIRASAVVVGRHGVLVRRGNRQGVFLPQVAPQYGWDREALLVQACRKAGLPDHAWEGGGAELFAFEAQVITAAQP